MPYTSDLQTRAADFLRRPIPDELKPHYVSGSIAEIVITHCARAEALDPDLCELAEMSAESYDDAIADARTPDLKTYYTDCQQLLREIIESSH